MTDSERAQIKSRLIGVLGMCPKCGGTRPTCCICPEHDQPTHYYREGESIPAGEPSPVSETARLCPGPPYNPPRPPGHRPIA
jgi:hypothetical protein